MKRPKIVVRVVNEGEPFNAKATGIKMARHFHAIGTHRVKLEGETDRQPGTFPQLEISEYDVSIFTGPPKPRPTETLELRAKSCAEELNAALYDLGRSVGRDDLRYEALALEHEAKALYNRILRLQSHRKWLSDRGLAK